MDVTTRSERRGLSRFMDEMKKFMNLEEKPLK